MCMCVCMYVSLYLSMNVFTNTMLIISYVYVCMYVCMGDVVGVWQVAGSSALSYCKGRVPYLVSGMKIYPSV
jgi:hypothetical protein